MNIMMIGHSGAGKTSFMAGMYKYLGDDTTGFGIKSKNPQQKARLEKMAADLSRNKYPSPTDIQAKYEFAFTVLGKELVPFNWLDYRGGVLTDDSEEEMDSFLEAIKYSDALVVFLDGQKLVDSTNRWNFEYDIIISCIENALTVSHESWFPISFVITKVDTVPDGAIFYGIKRFYNLLSQIEKSKKIGAIVTQCWVNSQDYYRTFIPLAYSVYGGSPIYVNRYYEAKAQAEREAELHRPTSLIGKLFGIAECIVNIPALFVGLNWETEYEKTWAAEENAKKIQTQLDELMSYRGELLDKIKEWSKEGDITLY